MISTNRERAQRLLKAYDRYVDSQQAPSGAQPLASLPAAPAPAPFRVRSLLWLLPLLQA
ncbi:hypothetical protein H6F86_05695 [Phormidium sp. FACHB-592]|uniref:Uncharacterized protein n=1 Tax=Stenomitos frigidus AS-A4 TaxID=2933935 RepID=A0ABV0KPV2_9CYAN|nr:MULTISPECIES: hypothetical protein [Cyanophyceae]MBD2034865.1 hypothetical protein [Leptolyngbya sp. FACHB-321]MBD2073385.1 hypothetical protein [Phormidium sp. FACHB-592]